MSSREDTREDSNVRDTNKADTSHQHVDGADGVDEEDSHSRSGSSTRSGPQPEVDEDWEVRREYELSRTWRCWTKQREKAPAARNADPSYWASEDRRDEPSTARDVASDGPTHAQHTHTETNKHTRTTCTHTPNAHPTHSPFSLHTLQFGKERDIC